MSDEKLPERFRPSPESMICFDLYATHHAVGQVYQPLLAELGLTYPQYLVLVTLWTGDGMTVGALGGRLNLESSTLTPLVKRLEKNGLLRRERDKADERKVRVHLTETGREMETRASHIPGCIAEAFGLPMPELKNLHDILLRVRESLKASVEAD
ncbi:MAG: MarR family transcriptional regulator [Rhizobiales bacterium]|nr:MarR family transcriptional regulator [Hyphomicrobiales bacterium]MBA70048.1 MarR family transcriptional regulator [Hyphomicrobiales bacterium]